ncbi:MAG: macro domain-containing protein [Natronincolaceae bacterium]|jgi:O-acetyl-ADP-ribose deacetylase (regulator of RNase III)|nr:macro domain-containing protein [Bacillota bacterium]NLK90081.1 RNase III inhibitor [Clostridiales bacterium]
MPFKIIRNDITKMKTDAIVNAANINLQKGGGVCGAIFNAAGSEELQKECNSIGKINVGEAVITSGYKLDAKYVIHTVGPIWRGGNHNEENLLYSAYKSSLNLALKNNIKSISFPLISSGIYGYPKHEALKIAISAIGEFLLKHEMDIYLVVYGKDTVLLSERIFSKIEEYIDDNYVEEIDRKLESYELQNFLYESRFFETEPSKKKRKLEDVLKQTEETFSEMLLRLIDEKGMTDIEAYKNANVDRKLFSKIRSKKDYRPSKATAIAFAVSLKLNLDETRDLLRRAGYALSPSSKFDLIIKYYIEEGNYDIYEINEALFSFDQMLLGV